jgi:hypothetical protein
MELKVFKKLTVKAGAKELGSRVADAVALENTKSFKRNTSSNNGHNLLSQHVTLTIFNGITLGSVQSQDAAE